VSRKEKMTLKEKVKKYNFREIPTCMDCNAKCPFTMRQMDDLFASAGYTVCNAFKTERKA